MTHPCPTALHHSLLFLLTITNRDMGERIADFYRQHGLNFNMICPGYGAPGIEVRDFLGLTEIEKDILISVAGEECVRAVLPKTVREFHFERPNTGILFTIPIAGISGLTALHYVIGDLERNDTMPPNETTQPTPPPAETRKYDLIVTVVNRGFADTAVEAAKRASAHGCTIFYARGTGIHEVEKFFGMAIQPEKEVLLSLVRHNLTRLVMSEIVKSAGLTTPGRGLAFALPVEDVAGILHFGEVCPVVPSDTAPDSTK